MLIDYTQLDLFAPVLPEWNKITAEHLFNYLSSLYPDMKFKLNKGYDYWDNEEYASIEQTAYKKVRLIFDLGRYDDKVTFVKNRNYIGCSTEKLFGDWCGMSETYDCLEDFLEIAPLRVKQCKDQAKKYNQCLKNKNRKRYKNV